jgi:ArsR family transcriptional regulator, arsenate/arsenite/antimonite-responsive transcriptional repressor
MDVIDIYKCFCDVNRLRILNLLREGPLCVCHLQEILGEPQVKMSKHLGYMKRHGLLAAERKNNWTIYSIPTNPHHILEDNLKCLQDCQREMPSFRKDLQRRKTLLKRLGKVAGDCPEIVVSAGSNDTCSASGCC